MRNKHLMRKYSLLILPFFLFTLFACQDAGPATTKPIAIEKPIPEKKEQSDCIKRIIALDNQLWDLRNEAPLKAPLSDAINTYATALERTDFIGCPQDFQQAFMKHIAAWREIIAITDKHPDLRGKMLDLFNQLEKGADGAALNAALAKIDATWLEVEATMN